MLLNFLRLLFCLIVVAIGLGYAEAMREQMGAGFPIAVYVVSLVVAVAVVGIDMLIPRKSLASIGGLFFGLIVGMLLAYGLSLVLDLTMHLLPGSIDVSLVATLKLVLGVICCYYCVSFIFQTKDDIRFVVPYVEFAKQMKGQHPLILDTSVIIDGRIADICETRVIDQQLVVPRFVLLELQAVADSGDRLKRNRGRRGLDIVNKMQGSAKIEMRIMDGGLSQEEMAEPVDQRLLVLAKKLNGRVVTNDYNLNKVAQVNGVEVININDLANALKPVVLPGERLELRIIRSGQEPGQGVGYLDDGTMVVVEGARERQGDLIGIIVTSALQTSAGRMVFGRVEDASEPPRRPR